MAVVEEGSSEAETARLAPAADAGAESLSPAPTALTAPTAPPASPASPASPGAPGAPTQAAPRRDGYGFHGPIGDPDGHGTGGGTGAGTATGTPFLDRPGTDRRDGATRPSSSAGGKAKRSPLVLELGVIAFLGWIYDWLQNLAPLRERLAFSNGRSLLSFERSLGLAPERALNHWLDHHYVLAYISSDFYDNAIFGVTLGMAAWVWWRRPDIYRTLRNDLVLANLAGFAVFWLYPVAPPRMLPGFVDVVEKVGGLGSWHNLLISHADQMAAMPSMHLAWALWCSLAMWRLATTGRQRRVVLAVGVAYPLTTAWVVMATANHYLADVVAGCACTVLSVLVVEAALPAAIKAVKSNRAQ
jgi:hypothetical protein